MGNLFLGAAPYKVCTCKHGTDTSVTPTAAGVWFFKFFWAALLGTGDATKEKDGVPSIKRKFSSDCMQERSIQRGCHFWPKSKSTLQPYFTRGFSPHFWRKGSGFWDVSVCCASSTSVVLSYENSTLLPPIKLELHALGTGVTPQVLKARGSSGLRFLCNKITRVFFHHLSIDSMQKRSVQRGWNL